MAPRIKVVHHTQHPQYPILEVEYDAEHRAQKLSEGVALPPLRPRTHSKPLRWDERYEPYIRRSGFIDLVRVVNKGLPPLNPALLTAAVDRWRPETHTFHLVSGEQTITLQDVKYNFGLRLGGLPVTGKVDPDLWRQAVFQFCGHMPPDDEVARRQKKTSGVTAGWIMERFDNLPELADDLEIQRYARVWLWYFIASFLFPDSSGNTISWRFLDILRQPWENIAAYSWGSAVLAWTYRQLCEACRRTSGNANLGGCSYLLQAWCWSRWPVGRPIGGPVGRVAGRLDLPRLRPWEDQDTKPTGLYLWTDVNVVTGNGQRKYREYTDALDLLTQHQVNWCPWDDPALRNYLSSRCQDETDEYRCHTPLIFYHVVEMHLPMRVCRQFGRLTDCPPPLYTTNPTLHSMDSRKRYDETDWRITHRDFLELWHNRDKVPLRAGEPHDQSIFDEYLRWLHRSTRIRVKGPYTGDFVEDDPDEEVYPDMYDLTTVEETQVQRAPLETYVATELSRLSNEAAQRLHESTTQGTGVLVPFVQKVKKTLKKLAQKLSCMDTPWEPPEYPEYPMQSTSTRTPAGTSEAPTGTTSAVRTPPHCSAGKGPANEGYEDYEEDYVDEEDEAPGFRIHHNQWDPWERTHEEIGRSQLGGAPFGTQGDDQGTSGTQHHGRQHRHRDHTDVGYTPNVVPTNPKRQRRRREPYTPGT